MATDPTRRTFLRHGSAVVGVGALGGLGGCAEAIVVPENVVPPGEEGDTGNMAVDSGPLGETADTGAPPPPDPPVPFDPDDVAELGASFPLALQVGSVRSHAALLVTRVVGAETVRVRAWRLSSVPGEVFLDVDETVTPGDGGYLRTPLLGLEADATYLYALFLEDDTGALTGRSPVARFVTPPLDDVEKDFTVALLACNGSARGREDAIGRLADLPVDAILHLGDMVYNDGAETLQEFRDSWAEWMGSEGYKAGLATAGLYATWDDHEIDNNWDPESIDPAKRDAAAQAFLEHVAAEPGPGGLLWNRFRWGRTAEIFVLDCRSERRPSSRLAPDATYLSRAQMDWLKQGLASSDAVFKIVMNSVPITNMPGVWDLAADDRWEGYPAARDELLDHIRQQDLADVWFVSGDFHVCFAAIIQSGGVGRVGRTFEIACTSGNINPLGDSLPAPQFRFGSGQPHLVLLDFLPASRSVRVRMVRPSTLRTVWDRTLRQ